MSIRKQAVLGLSAIFCMVAAKTTQAQTTAMDHDLTSGIATVAMGHVAANGLVSNAKKSSEAPPLTEAEKQLIEAEKEKLSDAVNYGLVAGALLMTGAAVGGTLAARSNERAIQAEYEKGSKNEPKVKSKKEPKAKKKKKWDKPKFHHK